MNDVLCNAAGGVHKLFVSAAEAVDRSLGLIVGRSEPDELTCLSLRLRLRIPQTLRSKRVG